MFFFLLDKLLDRARGEEGTRGGGGGEKRGRREERKVRSESEAEEKT